MPERNRWQEMVNYNAAINKASEMVEQWKDTRWLLVRALQWIADWAWNLFWDHDADWFDKREVTSSLRWTIEEVKEDNR